MDASGAVVLNVTVEIEVKRILEFLRIIEEDAIESRKEPGCRCFHVSKDKDQLNKFYFYEAYINQDAVNYHKLQPHYLRWADFKTSGGVISSSVTITEGVFL